MPAVHSSPPAPADSNGWTKVLTPEQPLFSMPMAELWEYRDLIWTLAARNITTYYKQTILGPLWFVVQPLLITAVFSYLFGRMARFGSDDIPHYLFYMGGLVPWTFFSESVLKNVNIFADNQPIFSKVYFPRLSVPISNILTNLVVTAVQFGLFLAGLFFYLLKHDRAVHPNWWILATPFVFVQVGAFALGIGCIVSALSRRFHDFAMGMKVGMQLLMFGSAIVFPLADVASRQRFVFFLNPVVPPIEFFRYAFLGKSLLQPWQLGLSALISALTLFVGLIMFNRAAQNAMDTV